MTKKIANPATAKTPSAFFIVLTPIERLLVVGKPISTASRSPPSHYIDGLEPLQVPRSLGRVKKKEVRLSQAILTQTIRPKGAYFNSYWPWRFRATSDEFIVKFAFYIIDGLAGRKLSSPFPGCSWLGLLGGIEKVAVVLEGVLCPETEKGGIRSKILLGWG